jgi:hypothetical protein
VCCWDVGSLVKHMRSAAFTAWECLQSDMLQALHIWWCGMPRLLQQLAWMSDQRCLWQGINAILFFAPLIFKSLGKGQSSSLLGAAAVSTAVSCTRPECVRACCQAGTCRTADTR